MSPPAAFRGAAVEDDRPPEGVTKSALCRSPQYCPGTSTYSSAHDPAWHGNLLRGLWGIYPQMSFVRVIPRTLISRATNPLPFVESRGISGVRLQASRADRTRFSLEIRMRQQEKS